MLKPAVLISTCLLFLTSCIVVGTPTRVPEKHPFRKQALDFLVVGEATKSDVLTHIKSAEIDRRIHGPNRYREDSVWALSATREMWQWWWCVAAGTPGGGGGDCGVTDRGSRNYRLLIYFDSNDIVDGFDILPEEECVKAGFCLLDRQLIAAARPFQEGANGLFVDRPRVNDVVALLGEPRLEYFDDGDTAYFYNNPPKLLLQPLLRQFKTSTFVSGDFSLGITFNSDGFVKQIQEFDKNQCYQGGFCVVAGSTLVPIPQISTIDKSKGYLDKETAGGGEHLNRGRPPAHHEQVRHAVAVQVTRDRREQLTRCPVLRLDDQRRSDERERPGRRGGVRGDPGRGRGQTAQHHRSHSD